MIIKPEPLRAEAFAPFGGTSNSFTLDRPFTVEVPG